MTLNVGKTEVQNDQRRVLLQKLQGNLAIGSFNDVITLCAQTHPQQFADRWLIVDHHYLERCGVHAAVSNILTPMGIGNLIDIAAPLRSVRFAAEIVPCMASMNPREIARPRPVPARMWSPFCAR